MWGGSHVSPAGQRSLWQHREDTSMPNTKPPLLRLMLWDRAGMAVYCFGARRAGMVSTALPCGCQGREFCAAPALLRATQCHEKSGSFLDDQLGVLYGSQQEPDSKQLEFYGRPLIPAFRSEPQRSPRTLQHYI